MGNVFLLVGTHRSGTTLLSKVLSVHPKIFVQNETKLEALFSDDSFDLDTFLTRIHRFLSDRAEVNALGAGAEILGLKDPQLIEYAEAIEGFAMYGKVLVIVRDPRGVVNSYIDNRWGLGTNAFTGAQRWSREVDFQLSLKERFRDNVCLIRYEDLIGEMENTLRKVCAFLEIGFHEAMLAFHGEHRYMKLNKQSVNINSPLDQQIAEKWRDTLSPRQISIIECICSKQLSSLGYTHESMSVSLSMWERLYYRAHQAVLGELQIQYQWRKSRLRSRINRKR